MSSNIRESEFHSWVLPNERHIGLDEIKQISLLQELSVFNIHNGPH